MSLPVFFAEYRWLLIPLFIWSLVWKGMALWKAARRADLNWFIVLLVVNTVGILDIIYIYLVARNHKKTSK